MRLIAPGHHLQLDVTRVTTAVSEQRSHKSLRRPYFEPIRRSVRGTRRQSEHHKRNSADSTANLPRIQGTYHAAQRDLPTLSPLGTDDTLAWPPLFCCLFYDPGSAHALTFFEPDLLIPLGRLD